MAISVRIDRWSDLTLSERFGVPMRLTRRAYVSGLTEKSYKALKQADGIDAGNAGLPGYGSRPPEGYENLILVERNFGLLDQDKAAVDLVYEHRIEGGQNLSNPQGGGGISIGKMQASIQQVRSNKDENGNMIVLEHTFSSDDQDPYYRGKTIKQTGEIEDFVPQKVFDVEGMIYTYNPYNLVRNILGSVNAAVWGGDPARTWMCTEAKFQTLAYGESYFWFQFQHNPDTWDSTAVFIDTRTGLPPTGLVADKGYKTIKKKKAVNFNDLIGSQVWAGSVSGSNSKAVTSTIDSDTYDKLKTAADEAGMSVSDFVSGLIASATADNSEGGGE